MLLNAFESSYMQQLLQSGTMEAPASIMQKFNVFNAMSQNSVYLVQLSKSGKYAWGKKVAENQCVR